MITPALVALALALVPGTPTPAASKAWTPAGFVKPSDAELQRRLTALQY
jgi:hypothetical protein